MDIKNLTVKATEDLMPHIEALIEVIRNEAVTTSEGHFNPNVGAHQFAYGGIAIQLFVHNLLLACPEMSKGKSRELFDTNYATAVRFGTMLFFAKSSVTKD